MNMHEDISTYQTKYKNQTNNEIFLLNARYMELETKKIKQRWILEQKYGYWLLLPSRGRGKRVSKDSSFLKCESKIIPHGKKSMAADRKILCNIPTWTSILTIGYR